MDPNDLGRIIERIHSLREDLFLKSDSPQMEANCHLGMALAYLDLARENLRLALLLKLEEE